MDVNRNLAQEYKDELEEILMDQIRSLYRRKTADSWSEKEIVNMMCNLSGTLISSLTSSVPGENNACDSNKKACCCGNCVNYRKRK